MSQNSCVQKSIFLTSEICIPIQMFLIIVNNIIFPIIEMRNPHLLSTSFFHQVSKPSSSADLYSYSNLPYIKFFLLILILILLGRYYYPYLLRKDWKVKWLVQGVTGRQWQSRGFNPVFFGVKNPMTSATPNTKSWRTDWGETIHAVTTACVVFLKQCQWHPKQ